MFKVIKPGLQTTVQDLGRFGFQQIGISPSGAMDPYSMQLANILVGNSPNEAVLEVALMGPTLEVLTDLTAAVCGGNFSLNVDGRPVPMWKSFQIKKGQILSVGVSKLGARAYLAVSGGVDVPDVLGSKSTFLNGRFGGYHGRALQSGDILSGNPSVRQITKRLHPALIPIYKNKVEVRIIFGPHHEMFTSQARKLFLTEEFTVTPESNRMGYQLKGPKIEHSDGPDIISDAVPLGGIQVPKSGQPIILMADRQTTGGYARIGTVISVDIPVLAQAVPGTVVKFSQITLQEAQDLYLEQRKQLRHVALSAK